MTDGPESGRLRRELVGKLREDGLLGDALVAGAFLTVPRERFVPEAAERDGLAAVYADRPILTRLDARGFPISSSSQPAIMAAMLEALCLRPGQRVLEVGAGTGYNAALLAELAGPTGRVVSVELEPETAEGAAAALAAGRHRAEVVVGDGRAGWPPAAPYDRMIVTASAASVPHDWFEQLVPGGRLVVPLRVSDGVEGVQVVGVLDRDGDGFTPAGAICGGFMSLRTQAGVGYEMPPSLGGLEWLGDGDRTLARLSGTGLAGMPEPARRRLLGFAVDPQRARRARGRLPNYPVELFLGLAAPPDRLVAYDSGRLHGLGIVDRRGRGLAVLAGGSERLTRVLAGGDRGPEDLLDALVDEWRSLGRPTEDALRLGVRYGRRVGRHWRTLRRDGCTLVADWAPPAAQTSRASGPSSALSSA
jgi:protein-L-isoaspartate(D-aspartate) O-methyltransferase